MNEPTARQVRLIRHLERLTSSRRFDLDGMDRMDAADYTAILELRASKQGCRQDLQGRWVR